MDVLTTGDILIDFPEKQCDNMCLFLDYLCSLNSAAKPTIRCWNGNIPCPIIRLQIPALKVAAKLVGDTDSMVPLTCAPTI